MTLLVALAGTDGIALAADSRGTFGDPREVTAQNDAQQTAHIVAPHVAALTAGTGPVGALIIAKARESIDIDQLDGATPVMEVLRETARDNYEEWFPSVPAVQPLQAVINGTVPVRRLGNH